MTNVWCVRAEFGTFTKHFVEGGYVAIGWLPNTDLSAIRSRDELYPIYKAEHPDDTSNIVIGQQVGQIARFLLEISDRRLCHHACCRYRVAALRAGRARALVLLCTR